MKRRKNWIVDRSAIAITLVGFVASYAPSLNAQLPELAQRVQDAYVEYYTPEILLTHVTLIDGTGAPAARDQSILVRDGRIAAVGPSGSVQAPASAQVVDFSGHTVIPGIVGLHDHLFYMAAGGRTASLTYSGPRLYLGAGVTTIRTTGSISPYGELNMREAIRAGDMPGPRIHITAPYITGGNNGNGMAQINSPEQARRFVRYWSEEGATWLKAYTNIRTEDLAAAIDEAHKVGMKVTGHICSVSFTGAAELGIDNIEHGLLTNSDYSENKERDVCPVDQMATAGTVSMDDPRVQNTFDVMIGSGVPMTSTLAVFELFIPGRGVGTRDPRALEAMAPEVREDYLEMRETIDASPDGYPFTPEMLQNAMAYELAFVNAGGKLAAGVDPTGNGGALPGYGDQRNYELLIEAGFTPEQSVRILTLNGAEVLGVDGNLGSIEVGKLADLVVIGAELSEDAAHIQDVHYVFKGGVGYDSEKLLDAVRGRVGIN